jgi:hypothetical protein
MRRRNSPWRLITFISALLVAVAWIGVSGWWVSQSWPLRNAMGRVEQAREQAQCSTRSGSQANQIRCRELVEIMHRAETAELYFVDGLLVFGPSLLLIGVAFWARRGDPPGRTGSRHPPRHHHQRPTAA